MNRIFLLSPAHCGGERAQLVVSPRAGFTIAQQLRQDGAALGDVFSFMSGLYFRGKLAYARAFARPPRHVAGALVITPGDGLRPPDYRIDLQCLRRFAAIQIDATEPRYRRPLVRDARRLAAALEAECEVVLLGSVATGKYVDVLLDVFGSRLRFPSAFVGRGDMSRGGLMLRCVDAGEELEYVALAGARRHGPRPPKLARR